MFWTCSNNSSPSRRDPPPSTFRPCYLYGGSRIGVCYVDPPIREIPFCCWEALVQEWSCDQSCPMRENVRTFVDIIRKETHVFLLEENIPRVTSTHYYNHKGKAYLKMKPVHRYEVGPRDQRSKENRPFWWESLEHEKPNILLGFSVEFPSSFCWPVGQFTLGFSLFSITITTYTYKLWL